MDAALAASGTDSAPGLPLLAAAAGCCALLVALLAGIWLALQLRVARTASTDVLLRVQRLERERIARELHDTFLQSVQTLAWSFQSLADRLPADCDVRAAMTTALALAESTLAEGRNHLVELRAPDGCPPFADALRAKGLAMARCHDARFETTHSGQAFALHPLVNHEVARIAGEALLNAFRHARAARIELIVRYAPSGLFVCVRDDGRGISPEVAASGLPGHLGLAIMRERARAIGAALRIVTSEGGGTAIELRLPTRRTRVHAPAPARAWRPSWRRLGALAEARAEAGGAMRD